MAPRNKPKSSAPDEVASTSLNPIGFDVDAQAWHEEMASSCVAPALPSNPANPERSPDEQGRVVIPNPYSFRTDKGAGVTLSEDRQLRRMQLTFDEKPSDLVRMALREAGFKWNSPNAAWEIRVDREQSWTARAAADKTFQHVSEMIRQERGISAEVG